MTKLGLSILAVGLAAVTVYSGEIKVTGSVATQLTKNSAPADVSPLADSWVRAEPKISTTSDSGISGLIHLRLEPKMGSAAGVGIDARQLYFELPVFFMKVKVGRWYEVYTPGTYFGRYLFMKPTTKGSGSMCTNYSIIDGFRLNIPIVPSIKTDVNLAFLPGDVNWKSQYVMILATTQPIEQLKFKVGADIQAVRPVEATPAQHRMSVTAEYSIIKSCGIGAELGIVNLDEASDNMWILGTLDIPTAGIMDQVRVEVEYKKDRIVGQPDADVAYTLGLVKKVVGLQFNLNVSADPATVASLEPADVGFVFRTTAAF